MNTLDFTRGMTVRAHDGNILGTIEEIWAETRSHGLLPVTRHLVADYGPVKGTHETLSSPDGYLQVRQGAIFGLGGRDLHIPLSQVERVESSSTAVVGLPANVCEVAFGGKRIATAAA